MRIAFLGNFRVDYTSETHHKKSLEALGHEVTALQEGDVPSSAVLRIAREADLFVWVHTHGWQTPGEITMVEVLDMLKLMHIPTVTYHLDLWFGLQRQADLDSDSFYQHIGHFFTADKQMAVWFNEETDVEGHYLPAGVFDAECKLEEGARMDNEVVFVGSRGYHPEWPYRPQLVDWLRTTYGPRFRHFGGDGIRIIRGHELTRLYNTTKVVVGDTLCLNFDYPYYWSDRVYETIGRGGFIIHPYIEGMEDHFVDRKHLVYYEYGNFDQLKELVDYYCSHDDERETIRRTGYEHVKNNHTYLHRWEHIVNVVSKTEG